MDSTTRFGRRGGRPAIAGLGLDSRRITAESPDTGHRHRRPPGVLPRITPNLPAQTEDLKHGRQWGRSRTFYISSLSRSPSFGNHRPHFGRANTDLKCSRRGGISGMRCNRGSVLLRWVLSLPPAPTENCHIGDKRGSRWPAWHPGVLRAVASAETGSGPISSGW
jgi:hypothetical protein